MIAPLQLIDYTAETVSYNRLDPKPAPDNLNVGVGLGFEINSSADEERAAQCLTLNVHFNNREEDIPEEMSPYIAHRGQIRVRGWIQWVSDEMAERDDAQKLLHVNGLAMLYGIARVHTAQLTEGRTSPRLLLPSISFQPMVEDWMQADKENSENSEDV
jgi:hypothetical protein